MPIYAYRCDACGFAKDVLQKLSDAQLTECPSCGRSTFKKQVTAAGFQLKGSGWYATDFRGGKAAPADGEAKSPAAPAASPESGAASTPAPATTSAGPGTPDKSGTSGGSAPSAT